jgi:hypothetical protein
MANHGFSENRRHSDDVGTDPFSLLIVSGNREKIEDIKLATNTLSVKWVHFEPTELQASKELDSLRLQGETNYPQIAKLSALQKFELIKRDLAELSHGYTIVDSTLWVPCLDGLPGLNTAQIFASYKMPDGSIKRSDAMLSMYCRAALDGEDRRVYWIETAVTAELSDDGNITPRIRQQIGLCFMTRAPYESGVGMWPITCPNPLRLAAFRKNEEALAELSSIEDTKWELPERAERLGLLASFAELEREERVMSSPRGELFAGWAEL